MDVNAIQAVTLFPDEENKQRDYRLYAIEITKDEVEMIVEEYCRQINDIELHMFLTGTGSLSLVIELSNRIEELKDAGWISESRLSKLRCDMRYRWDELDPSAETLRGLAIELKDRNPTLAERLNAEVDRMLDAIQPSERPCCAKS